MQSFVSSIVSVPKALGRYISSENSVETNYGFEYESAMESESFRKAREDQKTAQLGKSILNNALGVSKRGLTEGSSRKLANAASFKQQSNNSSRGLSGSRTTQLLQQGLKNDEIKEIHKQSLRNISWETAQANEQAIEMGKELVQKYPKPLNDEDRRFDQIPKDDKTSGIGSISMSDLNKCGGKQVVIKIFQRMYEKFFTDPLMLQLFNEPKQIRPPAEHGLILGAFFLTYIDENDDTYQNLRKVEHKGHGLGNTMLINTDNSI